MSLGPKETMDKFAAMDDQIQQYRDMLAVAQSRIKTLEGLLVKAHAKGTNLEADVRELSQKLGDMSTGFRSVLADATGLGARNRELVALLRKHEWASPTVRHKPYCRACLAFEDDGHEKDCDVGSTLEDSE